jgi:hypothetical protein
MQHKLILVITENENKNETARNNSPCQGCDTQAGPGPKVKFLDLGCALSLSAIAVKM